MDRLVAEVEQLAQQVAIALDLRDVPQADDPEVLQKTLHDPSESE